MAIRLCKLLSLKALSKDAPMMNVAIEQDGELYSLIVNSVGEAQNLSQ
jgi:hypothetical protein